MMVLAGPSATGAVRHAPVDVGKEPVTTPSLTAMSGCSGWICWGAGACLADDMGLGKTVQTIAVLLAQAEMGPSIIIAPTSVCHNWETNLTASRPRSRCTVSAPATGRTGGGPGPGDASVALRAAALRKPTPGSEAGGRFR